MAGYGKTYSATFSSNNRDEIDDLHARVIDAMTRHCINQHEINRKIFMLGLQTLEEEDAEEGKLSLIEAAVVAERRKIQERMKIFENYNFLYQQWGRDKFISWYTQQPDHDPDLLVAYLEHLSERRARMSWSERAKIWAFERLADGNPCAVSDIRTDAIREGIIADTPEDWNRFRQLAWRNGLSKDTDYGYWQLPSETA